MTKSTKRRRVKKRRPGFFAKNKFLIMLLGVAALALISLVFLARLEEQPESPAVVSPATKSPRDYTTRIHQAVDSLFFSMGLDPASIQRDLDQSPPRYSVSSEFPSQDLLAGFAERLRTLPGHYTVRLREANSLTVEKDRQPQIIIHFTPPPVLPDGPLMTIIMDDLGRSARTAEELVSFPEPVTFAILPGEPHAVEVAEIAHAAGHEVMLHVPMEPQGYPAVNPGDDALFVAQSEAEIRSRFDRLLAELPYVVGTNNHMGSRFTEDARALSPVMESLREKGFFFIDSRTTGQSKVTEIARRFGVPTMNRDVFLDNVAEVDAIVREIRRLVDRARSQGAAIGICHPYPETLEALRRELPEMRSRGVAVVPVSVQLQKQASIAASIERAQ